MILFLLNFLFGNIHASKETYDLKTHEMSKDLDSSPL